MTNIKDKTYRGIEKELTNFKNGETYSSSIDKIQEIFTTELKTLLEKVERMKKYHKEFECNGANNGKGCYETFCEDQNCRNAPKEYNSALTDISNIIKTLIGE